MPAVCQNYSTLHLCQSGRLLLAPLTEQGPHRVLPTSQGYPLPFIMEDSLFVVVILSDGGGDLHRRGREAGSR
jgi:hypothetical protein